MEAIPPGDAVKSISATVKPDTAVPAETGSVYVVSLSVGNVIVLRFLPPTWPVLSTVTASITVKVAPAAGEEDDVVFV